MALPTIAEMEAYIRQAAIQRGIDPDVAVRVAKSEGLQKDTWQSNFRKNGVREPSYGPFQLYMGGGLGNQMKAKTGLDPSDPANWRQGVDFALTNAAENKTWKPWYGAAREGIPLNAGFGGAVQNASYSPSQGPGAPVPPRNPPMGTAMTGFTPQRPPQAPQMNAGVNPMQGAPGTPPGRGMGLAGLFGGIKPGGMGNMAQALMGGASALGGMGGGQQQMAPANFVVPAAEPGMLDPSPRGGTDPRMAALIRLLSQNA